MRLILVAKKIEKEKKKKRKGRKEKEKKSKKKDIEYGSDQSADTIILSNTEEERTCQLADIVIPSATEGPCPMKRTQPSRGLVYWSRF